MTPMAYDQDFDTMLSDRQFLQAAADGPYEPLNVSPVAEGTLPDWLDDVFDELNSFVHLQPDWDSYGGRPTSSLAAQGAVELLAMLSRRDTPRPFLAPTSEGDVQLEWHMHDVDLEIRMQSPSKGSVLFEDYEAHVLTEAPLTSNYAMLKGLMQRLSTP